MINACAREDDLGILMFRRAVLSEGDGGLPRPEWLGGVFALGVIASTELPDEGVDLDVDGLVQIRRPRTPELASRDRRKR